MHNQNSTAKNRNEELFKWLQEFASKTTYEISIPVLRDKNLAPSGKSGIIVSTVFDYNLTKYIKENNLYNEFKEFFSKAVIDSLNSSIFKGFEESIIDYIASTPMTIEAISNNTQGSITGWAFSQKSPVEDKLWKIANSVNTPFENIYQSGHWAFSPSGLPTSIILGKIAAEKINKT